MSREGFIERLEYFSTISTGFIIDYINSRGFETAVKETMLYSVQGGKRLRPALLLGAFSSFSNDSLAAALPFAAAIEMIHTYSLIHDDLPAMDDDDMRRGKPSNHIQFGEAEAILAGDALLNAAAECMLENLVDAGEPGQRASVIIMKAAGAEGMIGGQSLDIAGVHTKQQLKKMYSMKTGALLKASAVAGAVLGGCSHGEEKYIGDFAEHLGFAFQIKDDLLDVSGDSGIMGKPTGSDEGNNKTTIVSLSGIHETEKLLDETAGEALKELRKVEADTWFLQELMKFIVQRKG